MKLYLVRHGETDWNQASRIQGQTDTPLNHHGMEQARKLAEKLEQEDLKIRHIYSSPQQRACETARIIGERLSISPIMHRGLEEMCMGKWEGYTWKQVREKFPQEYDNWYTNRRYQVTPAGESYQQLLERLLPALGDILEKETENTLIVTHSAVIMTLMSYLYDTPFEDMVKNYKTGNAAIVEVDLTLFYERIGREIHHLA